MEGAVDLLIIYGFLSPGSVSSFKHKERKNAKKINVFYAGYSLDVLQINRQLLQTKAIVAGLTGNSTRHSCCFCATLVSF